MKHLLLVSVLFSFLLVSCADEDQPSAPGNPVTTVGDSLAVVRLDDRTASVSWTTTLPNTVAIMIAWEKADSAATRDSLQLQLDALSARLGRLERSADYRISVTIRTANGNATLLPGFLKGVTTPLPPPAPTNPSGLEAVALASSTVGLRWTASTTTGATYLVCYRKVGATDTASSAAAGSGVVVSGSSATITGLTTGEYRFFVYAVDGGTLSSGATINWAPATRYTHEPGTPTTLRMYENASSSGSGLVINPVMGGPRNADLSAASTDPPGSIALAIYTGSGVASNTFDIGPAYAFLAFRNANKFDSSFYVSREGFSVSSLDDLYLRNSLDTYINGGGNEAGNISAFNLPAVTANQKGIAFIMHIGNGPGMHYARVIVTADPAGRLLRGVAPNRYVEVEISYQSVAGLPYAKGVVRQESVPAYRSTPR